MPGRIETNNLQAFSWAIIVFPSPKWAGPLRFSSHQATHARGGGPLFAGKWLLTLVCLEKGTQLNHLGTKQWNTPKILGLPASVYQ